MDDSEILLSLLYVNLPKGVTRQKIESAFSDYKVALERGEKITFGQMLVRRGILAKGQPERLLADEKAAYSKTKVTAKEAAAKVPSGAKTRSAAAPAQPRNLAKLLAPGLLVALLVGAIVWKAIPPKPTPDLVEAKKHNPLKSAWELDPFESREKDGTRGQQLPPDTTLDVRRRLISEAMAGDPDEVEKKLDQAIADSKDPDEKERLEQLRWELHFIKAQREKARKALEEAKKRALAGDREGAARLLDDADAPEGTPEGDALRRARRGEGDVGLALKPPSKKDNDTAPSTPRDKWRPSTRRRDLPPERSDTDGPRVPEPIPPPRAEGDGDGPIGGDFGLAKKPSRARKHGQRPRGETRGRDLVSSFVDEVDEDPGEDAPPVRPEDVKNEVQKIEAVTPLEVEPSRADALGPVVSAGLEYLANVQKWLDNERGYRDGALARERERVLTATGETPAGRFLRKIEIGPLTLRDAVVSEYTEKGFTIKDKTSSWGQAWTTDKKELADLALDVRKLAIDPDEPRDHMRFGRWLARRKYYPQAKKAFDKARAMDGSLDRRIPPIDILEKYGKAFAGKLARDGDGVRITWNFDSPAELNDWTRFGSVSVGHGRLLLDARDQDPSKALGATEIVSLGRVALEARIDGDPGLLVMGFALQTTDTESAAPGQAIFLRYDIESGQVAVLDGKRILAIGDGGHRNRIVRLELSKEAIEARVGKFYARIPWFYPPSWRLVPVVASAAGTVSVDQLVLTSRSPREWLEKTLGTVDFRVALLLEESVGAPPFAFQHPLPQLSAEIAYTATDVTPEILETYKRAKARLDKHTPGGVVAVGEMRWITEEAPDFAPAQYYVARYALEIDRPAFALECLNQAVTSAGGFAEALALRALVLARLRRFDDADTDMKKALEWRPDIGYVHEAAASLAFEEQRLEAARAELELAFALEPSREPMVEHELAMVSHVIDGPPWEKPRKVETDHYLWTSNMDKDKVEMFARSIESMRSIYATSLGIAFPEEKRKSQILLFDSQTSFLDYNTIATRTGLDENVGGVFFPLTKELEIFELPEDATGEKTSEILFHEGFHQFFDRIVAVQRTPYWANEGLGDYFGTTGSQMRTNKVGRLQRERLAELFAFGPIPVDDLMMSDARDFMSHAFQRYAQSWSVVHFIMQGDGGRWKPLLVSYLEHLRAGRSPVNAYNRTFGRIDMDEFEQAWLRYVYKLRDEANASR